jgi:hypothetical protein
MRMRSACLALAAAVLVVFSFLNPEAVSARPENGAAPIPTAAEARARVIALINQPVTHLPRTGDPEMFSPGWFHAGATKPDFATVDIRLTQEFPYQNATYVTSDLNPNEMFLGKELEFNAMTKYFYVDRSLPKKRLSEAEMIEINSLYRIIGEDEARNAYNRMVWTGLGVVLALIALTTLIMWRRWR